MPDLLSYLTIGSYLFGAAAWGFLYRELKSLRAVVEQLRVDLAFNHGKERGEDHERRITTLERA